MRRLFWNMPIKTPALHGTKVPCGKASGFILQHKNEKSVYVAGQAQAVVVANSGHNFEEKQNQKDLYNDINTFLQ
ncbi:MAG: hypothetical protein IJ738_05015 [Alphaproteobacteria bacterium]|nr:hypothetical protein [Alphaproteobacteria bacterium]